MKKKGLGINGIMAKFPVEGSYVVAMAGGQHVVRCTCDQKITSGNNRDHSSSILKHVETTNKHIEYIKKRKLSQLKHTQLLRKAELAEPGVACTHLLDGTRVSSVSEVD